MGTAVNATTTTTAGSTGPVGSTTPLIRLSGSAVIDPGQPASGPTTLSWESPVGGDGPLAGLTRREIEVASLHWVDGWPQATVAGWLGITPRSVFNVLAAAVEKAPLLAAVRDRAEAAPDRHPRVYHLSQLPRRDRERGAFNADEV